MQTCATTSPRYHQELVDSSGSGICRWTTFDQGPVMSMYDLIRRYTEKACSVDVANEAQRSGIRPDA